MHKEVAWGARSLLGGNWGLAHPVTCGGPGTYTSFILTNRNDRDQLYDSSDSDASVT